jgi:hypothetical protein
MRASQGESRGTIDQFLTISIVQFNLTLAYFPPTNSAVAGAAAIDPITDSMANTVLLRLLLHGS